MDNITKTGLEFVPEDIKKEFTAASNLMNSALNFIREIEDIVNQYDHLNKEISFFEKPLVNLKEAMLHNKELLQRAISQQYLFEQELNKFLRRTINFAWVDIKTGEVLFTDEVNAQKIYAQAETQTKGKTKTTATGKINASIVKSSEGIQILPQFVEENFRKKVEERLTKHQGLLKEVLKRWNQNHQKEEQNYWSREHYDTVYWEHPPEGVAGFHHPIYSWSKKVNRGHISQGYVNFIFNSMNNLEFLDGSSDSNEFSIGTFMMQNVSKKDQIPGIVKGDVIIKDNENIQIAVKSGNFDTASIGPYLRVAFQIIAFYDKIQSLTVNDIEEILSNTKKYNQKVTQAGRKKAQEILKKNIK